MKITREFPINEKNGNGRIYLAENFSSESLKKALKDKTMYGELGHPSANSFDISLDKSSHIIENIEVKENLVEITGEIFDKRLLEESPELIEELVFAPRGTGSMNEDGTIKDFKLITFDLINKHEASWLQ